MGIRLDNGGATVASVETRIENLESQLAKLQDEVRSMREGKKDWRRTIGGEQLARSPTMTK